MDVSRIDVSTNFVVSPGDPDYEAWAEQEAIENWIADGCPDVEGIHIPNQDREILLARPLTVAQAARREAVPSACFRRLRPMLGCRSADRTTYGMLPRLCGSIKAQIRYRSRPGWVTTCRRHSRPVAM